MHAPVIIRQWRRNTNTFGGRGWRERLQSSQLSAQSVYVQRPKIGGAKAPPPVLSPLSSGWKWTKCKHCYLGGRSSPHWPFTSNDVYPQQCMAINSNIWSHFFHSHLKLEHEEWRISSKHWQVVFWAQVTCGSFGTVDLTRIEHKTIYTVIRELSFLKDICYLSFRWVNILHAWTVNSMNRLVKNPKHVLQQSPFYPSLTFIYITSK